MEILPALKSSTSPIETSLTDLAARIQAAHEAATTAVRHGCEHAIKAGRLLIEAKNQVPHGQWLQWLQKHCQISERTAHYYMTLAQDFEANPQRVADLAMREAIKVITAPKWLKHNKQRTNLSQPGDEFSIAFSSQLSTMRDRRARRFSAACGQTVVVGMRSYKPRNRTACDSNDVQMI